MKSVQLLVSAIPKGEFRQMILTVCYEDLGERGVMGLQARLRILSAYIQLVAVRRYFPS